MPCWGSTLDAARNCSVLGSQTGVIMPGTIPGMPPSGIAKPPLIYRSSIVLLRRFGRRPNAPRRSLPGFIRFVNNPDQDQQTASYNQEQTCNSWCADGSFFEYKVPAGEFLIISNHSQADANAVAQRAACQRAEQLKLCWSPISKTPICLGQPYQTNIVAAGQIPPTLALQTEDASGEPGQSNLPPGLHFEAKKNSALGRIFGTPTTAGVFKFKIGAFGSIDRINTSGKSVTDSSISSHEYTLNVLGTVTDPPNGEVGFVYGWTPQADGGIPPYTFTVDQAALPPGLTAAQDGTGTISGIPVSPGTWSFDVGVFDSQGNVCIQSKTVIIAACTGILKFDRAPATPPPNQFLATNVSISGGMMQGSASGPLDADPLHSPYFGQGVGIVAVFGYVYSTCPQGSYYNVVPYGTGFTFFLDGIAVSGKTFFPPVPILCEGYTSLIVDTTPKAVSGGVAILPL